MPTGIPKNGINSGRFKKGIIPWIKGRGHSLKVRKKMSKNYKYHTPPNGFKKGFAPWNKDTKGIMKPNSGSFKKGQKGIWKDRKQPLSMKAAMKRGKEHWNWQGGIAENPYPKEFNKLLRLKIRQRDNFTCCLCGKTEREELEELNRILAVNHIDFNKNNSNENNLNTLCMRCNVKINRDRNYWTNYFNQL